MLSGEKHIIDLYNLLISNVHRVGAKIEIRTVLCGLGNVGTLLSSCRQMEESGGYRQTPLYPTAVVTHPSVQLAAAAAAQGPQYDRRYLRSVQQANNPSVLQSAGFCMQYVINSVISTLIFD